MRPRAQGRDRRGDTTLWFGVLGGALAWTVQFLTLYALSEGACLTALGQLELLGASGVTVLILDVTLVTALVALAATYAGYLTWTRWRHHADSGAAFMGLAGAGLSGIFLVSILIQALPALLVRGCP